ncbi:MAG: hypothetical protein GXP43_01275 [bacterium]|nr:hypothetical protein [bacterium]
MSQPQPLKPANFLESWFIYTFGLNTGTKLLFLSFGLAVAFILINKYLHLDWINYFAKPLCRS